MNKEEKAVVIEYAATLSDEQLRNLIQKLHERLSGDLAEALDMMSRNAAMDAMLGACRTAISLYHRADLIRDCLIKEAKKRGIIFKQVPWAA